MDLNAGMLVRSKAGRDKDCIYVINSVNDEYVYVTDGKTKPICHLKRKNRKHLQPIKKAGVISVMDDEVIRNHIKRFKNHGIQEMDVL